jgi:nucleotide-binding universal stress UspA family protein
MAKKGLTRLVLALDGSPSSSEAVAWAVNMAKGMDAEVVAVFALELPRWYVDYPGYESRQPPPEYAARVKTEFQEIWCKPLRDAGLQYRTVIKEGRPASVLLEVADELQADVIVMGRRGLGRVKEVVLGSVSHEVALHSQRPVLLVPGKA